MENQVKKEGYQEIDKNRGFFLGMGLEGAFIKMVSMSKDSNPLCLNFNGTYIYSDQTLDEAFLSALGVTHKDFTERHETQRLKYEKDLADHEANAPKLIEKWIEDGRSFVKPEYLDVWGKFVPSRVNDIYRGFDLESVKAILPLLDDEEHFAMAEEVFNSQNHSGASASIVLYMLKMLHENGVMFVKYVNESVGQK